MVIVIDPSGDLTISVVEYDDSISVGQGQEKVVLKVVDFLVKRSIIASNSDPLGALIALDLPYNAKPAFFQMEDLSTTSMEIWFRAFHDTMTPSSYRVNIGEIWNLAVYILSLLLTGYHCSLLLRWPVTCTISTASYSTHGLNNGTHTIQEDPCSRVCGCCCIHAGNITTRQASWKRRRVQSIIVEVT